MADCEESDEKRLAMDDIVSFAKMTASRRDLLKQSKWTALMRMLLNTRVDNELTAAPDSDSVARRVVVKRKGT